TCKNLSGAEEERPGADGIGARPETRAKLCRGETAPRSFEECETKRDEEVKFDSKIAWKTAMRWRRTVLFLSVLIASCLGLGGARAQQNQIRPLVLDMKIDGEIEPVLATYVEEGLADAANRHASL